ncbi:hypothetical protein [uncultured Gimesia sp.]|uniref:hypothetical protein n=1 Tax=uncultured Gimesia sp. TaxID=1678688 RepID=UPI0030D994D3|tara:strand:+ start:58940 stop:59197 length:258 start_codon:yes stop_codon:yes gene_type:complete
MVVSSDSMSVSELAPDRRNAAGGYPPDDIESNAFGNRFDSSDGIRMQLTTERQMANRATIASQLTSTAISLEIAQQAVTEKGRQT